MICNVTQASICGSETLSSLRFAQRAKKIRNKAVVNQDPRVARINALLSDNDALRRRLLEAEAALDPLRSENERLLQRIRELEAET